VSLSATEKLTLSEITGESVRAVSAASVDSDLETMLRTEIETWNANRNDVDLIISGGRDGVDLQTQRLLDRITGRVRVWLGFPEQKNDGCALPGSVFIDSRLGW